MSTARNSQIDDDPLALIAAYGEFLSQFGPDSDEAEDFLRRHPGHDDLFVDLTVAARRLRQSAKDRDKEARDQGKYLTTRIWYVKVLLVVLAVVLVSVLSASLVVFLYQQNERNKNLQILKFTNLAITPFVYYKIPVSQHENQNALSIYEGVEELATRLPPKDNESVWSKELLYAWARSALVHWQNAVPSEHEKWLKAVQDRIQYIRKRHPDLARIYSFEAQSELWQALMAKKNMATAEDETSRICFRRQAKTHYERSVELNRQAIGLEKDLTLAYNNLANGLLQLGSLAEDRPSQLKYFEDAGLAAEKAVSQAKLLFLLGQESTFTTYLDTLGDCYDALFSLYVEMGQCEKQKGLIVKALPIYTEIAWNYYGVDFKDMKDQRDANRYREYVKKNQARLNESRVLARKLNVTDLPELP